MKEIKSLACMDYLLPTISSKRRSQVIIRLMRMLGYKWDYK